MANPLKRLLGAATTSADIAAGLDKARAELAAAEAAVKTAEAQYEAGLLDLDKTALRKLLDAATEAKIDQDQINAKIARLQTELEKAQTKEAETGRSARYAEARRLSDAARRRLEREYGTAAETIRSLIGDVAAAQLAVHAANEDLPEGAAPLQGPEANRGTPTLYREDVGEEMVDLWVGVGSRSTPIPDELQNGVQIESRIRRGETNLYGKVQTETGGWMEVERRKFLCRRYLPQQSGRSIAPLASQVSLPPLYAGADPYWTAADHSPAAVLAELAKPMRPRPVEAERKVEIEYHPSKESTADE